MNSMTKRERLAAAIEGRAVDRVPVALWRHWPVDDQQPETLAWATVQFQNRYDFDLVKVTPSSSFCLRDWGAVDEWRGHYHGTREYGPRVIAEPDDWRRITPLAPEEGALGRQLEALRLIRELLGPDTPVIQTVFCPLSQAKNLAGQDQLLAHLRQAPQSVQAGLQTIAETTRAFVAAVMRQGCVDGIFYAVQFAQAHLLTPDEFRRFGMPHDRAILQAAGSGWLNMLHLHGRAVYLDLISDYPAQVFNWHDRETPPSLAQGLDLVQGAVCGGLRQEETLLYGTPERVRAEALQAIEETGGRRLIIGTGCVTPITSPAGNIRAARQAVEQR